MHILLQGAHAADDVVEEIVGCARAFFYAVIPANVLGGRLRNLPPVSSVAVRLHACVPTAHAIENYHHPTRTKFFRYFRRLLNP